MNKLLLLSAVAALAAGASAPAFAAAGDAVGSVGVTGSVAAKCTSASFSDTIVLNELAATNGTLDTSLPNNTGLTKSFKISCTSARPTVLVSATRLQNGTAGSSTGYTDVVDYTATAVATLADTSTSPTAYTTAAVLPGATSNHLTDRLANTATNLAVTLSAAHTTPATNILTAGSYSGTISITVQPTS